jgi:hypothetical protein
MVPLEGLGVDGEQVVDADVVAFGGEGDGGACRTSGTWARMARNVGGSVEERAGDRRRGVRPPSGKTKTLRPSRRVRTPAPKLESVARGLAVSMGIWPERFEVPADEGDAPELFFGEDAELEGQAGEDDRGIHVGGVVGGEDGGFGRTSDVFPECQADDLETGAGEEDEARAQASDAVLEAAVLVEEEASRARLPKNGGQEKGGAEGDCCGGGLRARGVGWAHLDSTLLGGCLLAWRSDSVGAVCCWARRMWRASPTR